MPSTPHPVLCVSRTNSVWLCPDGRALDCGPDSAIGATASQAATRAWAKSIAAGAAEARIAIQSPVVLALASELVHSAFLTNLTSRTAQDGLGYELEAILPITAEEWAIATWDDVCAAVAVDPLADYLTAFETLGYRVQGICPMALLDASLLLAKQARTNDRSASILLAWSQHERTEVLHTIGGRATEWRSLRMDSSAAQCGWEVWLATLPTPTELRIAPTGPPEWFTSAAIAAGMSVTELPTDALSQARSEALAGKTLSLPLDLRTDQFGGEGRWRGILTLARHAAWSLAASVLVASLAAGWYCWQMDQATAEIEERQIELFKAAFPNQRVPSALISRWESELQQKQATSNDGGAVERPVSVLPTVQKLLSALPTNIRFRFERLDFDGDKIRSDGQVRLHTETGVLTAALEAGGFELAPVSSVQAGDDTVRWNLDGRLRPTQPGKTP